MPEITEYQQVPLKDLLANVQLYKYNPSNMQRVILDHLENVSNGLVNIVDPTSPFIFLLESSTVNTAAAIIESEINLRKQYPALSQTEDEVYLHMSDKDFLDRFATPSSTRFSFLIQYNDLLTKLVDDPTNGSKRVTVLRETEFTVNGITFSLQYPIYIQQFYNGILQVSYDNTIVSPLQSLATNIIDHEIRSDASGVEWLYFEVDVIQFIINSTHYPTQSSTVFSNTIDFTDQYYYCRVYYKSNATNSVWSEILTTHTDQVYDPFKPTAVLKVVDQTLNIFIPPVYINSQLIDGNVRIDIYTTKGELTVDMSGYAVKAFSTVFKTVDEDRDVDNYSNAMNNVSYLAYSDKLVSGGSNQLTFNALREQVIYNAIGEQEIPITNVQLTSKVNKLGFTVVKNVDNITNRIFLATRNLPKPLNENLITPANITIDTVVMSLDQLSMLSEVSTNGDRTTLLSKSLYKNNNGQITLFPQPNVDSLKNLIPATLVETVNQNDFLYSPFYYVLDNSLNEFEVRAYHLDQPGISGLSFVSQNPTADLQVNTASYVVYKIDTGYRVVTAVKSDTFYKALADQYVQAQLAFIPSGENDYAYVNGTQIGLNAANERIFEFILTTNYDVDSSDRLSFTNFKMFSNENTIVKTPLTERFTFFYTTNSVATGYVADTANTLIGRFMLPENTVAITQETVKLNFGYSLKNLWTRSRSVAGGLNYQTYLDDQPLMYESDVYAIDPATGSIFTIDASGELTYTVTHHKGDPVLTENGDPVYKHRKGDIVLDSEGNPVTTSDLYTLRHVDMLFVDGNYYFATDAAYLTYRDELATVVNTWVTDSLADITDVLLEKTNIYFYPKKSIGLVSVLIGDDVTTTVESAQRFSVELYVPENIYQDTRIREQLTRKTIETLNTVIQETTISISDAIDTLRTVYGNSVISFNLSGLGGDANYETLTLINDNERLSLRKRLNAQDDGTLIVQEDVDVSFVKYLVK